jgi:outer membrane protein assembly factor BamB
MAATTTAWPTYHLHNSRDGFDTGEPAFTTAARAWRTSFASTDKVYAEPLVLNGVVYAVTQDDNVFALDQASGQVLWSLNVGTPVDASSLPCGNVSPHVGILSTPVIDTATGTLYALSYNIVGGANQHRLNAIDLATHTLAWAAAADPIPAITNVEQQRAALALANGNVYVAYGGLAGDCGSYHGLLAAISTSTRAIVAVREAASKDGDTGAGVWGPSGPAVDSLGNVYATTGNGSSNLGYDYSETVGKLAPDLSPLASWAPSNWHSLDLTDSDLGSMGPLLLSDAITFQSGKNGVGYLLRLSRPNQIGGELFSQRFSSLSANACFGGPAFDGVRVYVACNDGLYALTLQASPPSFSTAWHFGSGTFNAPIVAGGAVWSISGSTLYALDPGTGATRLALALGSGTNHFATPSAAGGLVLVPETTAVEAFRLS